MMSPLLEETLHYTIYDSFSHNSWYNSCRHNRAEHLLSKGALVELLPLLTQLPAEFAPWVSLVIIGMTVWRQISPLFSKPAKGENSDNFLRGDTKG